MSGGFKFNLGDRVRLIESEENGRVIGRAEYETEPNRYFVLYMCGDGRQTTTWWNEEHIVAVQQTK